VRRWQGLLRDEEEGSVEELAEANINGRQIRNHTRLARILYPEGRVDLQQMRDALSYGCA